MTKGKLIKITGRILVNQNIENTFDFFANPKYDSLWRKEINKSVLDGPLQVGVKVSEYSYLSKKVPNNLIELQCVDFEKNKIGTFETFANAKFKLKSERKTRAISDKLTEVFYTLHFDINIVKFALGFGLPKFLIKWKANSDMQKYLRKLKIHLDNLKVRPAPSH